MIDYEYVAEVLANAAEAFYELSRDEYNASLYPNARKAYDDVEKVMFTLYALTTFGHRIVKDGTIPE